jgi:hypothetical protein
MPVWALPCHVQIATSQHAVMAFTLRCTDALQVAGL